MEASLYCWKALEEVVQTSKILHDLDLGGRKYLISKKIVVESCALNQLKDLSIYTK